MPSSHNSVSGEAIHLWQLHDDCAREITIGRSIDRLRNDLGDGYDAEMLLGSKAGLKRWSITLPTLSGPEISVPTVTGINGETLSREEYVEELWLECGTSGDPFIFPCPKSGIFYMAKFENNDLSNEKEFRMQLYSTGVNIVQWRGSGESVLDPYLQLHIGDYGGEYYDNTTHSSPNWNAKGGIATLTDTLGTASFGATTQNGRNIVRLSPSSSATRLDSGASIVSEAFFVMKVREATFSNNGALLGTGSTAKIKGTSGGTKWQNPSHSGLRYWLNGIEYPVTNMQAPMNEWGVVRVRSATPLVTGTNASIGAETTSNGLEADIAEVHLYSAPLKMSFGHEVTEYLQIKWGLA